MAYSLTVNGIEREILIERLNINAPLQNKGTLAGEFLSADGSLVIDLEDEIILTLNSSRLFRGEVTSCDLRGVDEAGGDGGDGIIWSVVANDSSWPLDYRVTSATITAGTTLKAAIIQLMVDVPELTLDGSQVTGPTLPTDIFFSNTKLRDAFSQLISEAVAADTDGWFLRVTHLQVLEAIAPGDAPAPFNLVEGDGTECGDVQVRDRRDDDYATRVIVNGGIVEQVNQPESFTGDGVTDTFTLDFNATRTYGGVYVNAVFETLSIAPDGGATWQFDPATNAITRVSGAPAAAAAIIIYYDGWKQIIGDTGETSPPGRTVVEQVDGLFTTEDANAAAERLLVEFSASQKTVIYPTRVLGLQVGDAQSVTTAKRQIPTPTTFYVNEIVTTYDGANEGDGLLHQVTLKASQVVKGNFRQTYRQWARVGGGSAGVSTSTGVVSVGPSAPANSIQYNNGTGGFGGDAGFLRNVSGATVTADDTNATVIVHNKIGGATYGDNPFAIGTGLPAALAVIGKTLDSFTLSPDMFAQVWMHDDGAASKALSLMVNKFGQAIFQAGQVSDLNTQILLRAGNAEITSGASYVAATKSTSTNSNVWAYGGSTIGVGAQAYIMLDGFTHLNGISLKFGVNTTDYTIDSGSAIGVSAVETFKITTAKTCTLPALSSFYAASYAGQGGRTLVITNLYNSTALLTVAPAGSDIIRGFSGGLVLVPGQSVVLIAGNTGTGNFGGWQVIASHSPNLSGTSGWVTLAPVTITDTQTKALPTTAQLIIPAVASGYRIADFRVDVQFKFGTAAYTNINTDAKMGLRYVGSLGNSNYLLNSSAIPRTLLSDVFGAAGSYALTFEPLTYAEPVSDFGNLSIPLGTRDNVGVELYFNNNGSGNLTGGNSAQTIVLTPTYYYVKVS